MVLSLDGILKSVDSLDWIKLRISFATGQSGFKWIGQTKINAKYIKIQGFSSGSYNGGVLYIVVRRENHMKVEWVYNSLNVALWNLHVDLNDKCLHKVMLMTFSTKWHKWNYLDLKSYSLFRICLANLIELRWICVCFFKIIFFSFVSCFNLY